MGLFPPAPGGGENVDHGYKGKGVLLHLLVDHDGKPLAVVSSSAKGDERKMVASLISKSHVLNLKHTAKLSRPLIIFEADKGYDSKRLRQDILDQGMLPLIPYRGKRNVIYKEACEKFKLKSRRWIVERSIAWVKRKSRRLLSRWERLDLVWNAMATLSLIAYWFLY